MLKSKQKNGAKMKTNTKTFFDEVLKAEAMVETGIKNAEQKAQKILADTENEIASMRSNTMQKIKLETEKENTKLLQKEQKLVDEILKAANAEAIKLKKDASKKIEQVASNLVLEVISCL